VYVWELWDVASGATYLGVEVSNTGVETGVTEQLETEALAVELIKNVVFIVVNAEWLYVVGLQRRGDKQLLGLDELHAVGRVDDERLPLLMIEERRRTGLGSYSAL
jgi:hypothetical protein